MNYLYLALVLINLSPTCFGSSWNIKCRFADDHSNIFWNGETIEGDVEFVNTDHSNLVLERINGELIGEFSEKIQRKVNQTDAKNESKIQFLSQKTIVHPIGSMGKFPVPYGSHSWPFRFHLDDALPPSLNLSTQDRSLVHYFIRITFVRPQWYKSNPEHICPIIVKHSSALQSSRLENEITSKKKDVRMRVILKNNVVAPGDEISFDLQLHNPKRNLIRRVSMVFVRGVSTPKNRSSKVETLVAKDLEKTSRFNGKELKESYQIKVPVSALPSFSFQFAGNSSNYPLSISYTLNFEVHLRGFFTNAALNFPITVTNPQPISDDDDE